MPRSKQPATQPHPAAEQAAMRLAPDLGGISAPAPTDGLSPKFCPRCFRPEDQMGHCGDFALGCPRPAQLAPDQTVTIHCGPCGFTRIVPVGNLVQGRRVDELRNCQHDVCRAVRVS